MDAVIILVGRNPEKVGHSAGGIWGEFNTITGIPYHPADLPDRIEKLIKAGADFATVSPVVLSALTYLVRAKRIKCNDFKVMYLADDGDRLISMDVEGDFVQPWPEEGGESIIEASFYHRFYL